MNTNNINLKQPKIFSFAITISLFERLGFYILVDSLVLYTEKQLNWTDHKANVLYSVFIALVYLTPAIGGYLADNVFGIRRSIIVGLTLEGLGLSLISIPTANLLYPALALITLGVGFFKTAPTDLMARSYQKNDPRIDGGFTLFYMTINIGAATAAILAGFSQRYFGWHIAFLFSAIALYVGLVFYLLLRKKAEKLDVQYGKISLPIRIWLRIAIGTIIAFLASCFLITKPAIAQIFFYIATSCLFLYFAYEIAKSPKKEKMQIIACLALIIIGMVFFIMYFQLHTSITLFVDRCIIHNVLGFKLPTLAFISLNALWIIVLSPILVMLYRYLGKHRKDLAITSKFSLGILISAVCFLILKLSTLFANQNHQIHSIWLVTAIALFSFGELLVSALGVAMVTRIAPKRMYGVMMGAWFLISSSLGFTLGGKVANLADIPKTLHDPAIILNTYGNIYLDVGIAGIIIAIIAFAIGPYIKRIANIE